jgi:hypothetical protein
MTTFEKDQYSADFDHQKEVREIFTQLGFSNFNIETCLTNGCSHYISLEVNVLNEMKCWSEMHVENNKSYVTVRISDHSSNLERFGCVRNKMSFNDFKKLIANGAISTNN